VLTRPGRRDVLLLVLAIVAVSTSAPLVREAAAPALVIAFWRNAFAAGALVPISLTRHRDEITALDRRQRRLGVLAGVCLAAHFATWIPSLSFTSVASSVALVATQPIWAALIARGRGTRVPRAVWVGIGLAFAGAVILSGVDLSLSARALFGDSLALSGGILAAVYVTIGAEARLTMSTTVYTTICYTTAGAVLLVVCLASAQDVLHHPARTWWLLAAMTIGPQLLGHSVINRVLRTTSATVVSVAILFEIVGATVLAWWWFGETPPAGAYPAALLIGLGVVLVVRASRPTAIPVD
jgi:drug/metabolite transporter (DMT)-like permease